MFIAMCYCCVSSLTEPSETLMMSSSLGLSLGVKWNVKTPASDHPRLPHSKKHRAMSAATSLGSWGIMPLDNGTIQTFRRNWHGGNQLGLGPSLSTNERPVLRSRDLSRPIRGLGMAGAGPMRGRDGGSLRESGGRVPADTVFIFVNEMMSCKISHALKHSRFRETTTAKLKLDEKLRYY